MDTSVETIYGDILLKFKKFLVEEGVNKIIVNSRHNFIYAFDDTVGDGHGSNRNKAVINNILGETSKVSDTNQCKCISHRILTELSWELFSFLYVGASLLQVLLPPGPTWFNIHKYFNRLNFFFTITAFSLKVHVLETSGRKHFF